MKKIFVWLCGVLLLTGCGVRKAYESEVSAPQNAYGEVAADTTNNLAQVGWKQMFLDAQLQQLIDKALSSNTTVKTAEMRMEQAEIGYKTSMLAYFPTLMFSPSYNYADQKGVGAQNYAMLGVNASWQLDLFGAGVTNAKRQAKANKHFAQDYAEATRCRLVSGMAQLYYQLQGLDYKLASMREIEQLFTQTYESVQTLFEVGAYASPAVHQTKAELEKLKASILDIEHAVVTTEQAICQLLNEPYHPIGRSSELNLTMPETVGVGVPADLLRYRPDVRAAERKIEVAYYDVLMAKGALYPNIVISADGGWMSEPAYWPVNLAAQLVTPIFKQGKLRAAVKTSKIEQEIALETFSQTVIDACHEVTTSLKACQLAQNKAPHLNAQVEALREAVDATQELMNNGSTSYLEVLTALQSLLQAQISEADNRTEGAMALVKLYAALGGGER